jgi:O-antigen ligase
MGMTAAHCPALPLPQYALQPRTWAYRALRAVVLCALFSVILLPEFSRDGGETTSALYTKLAGGFRIVDVLLLLLVLGHVVGLACLRGERLHFPRSLAVPGAAFLGCIAFAMAYGANRGGSNFFFDWRGLALGIGLYFVWACWMQGPSQVEATVRVFLAYMGLRIALLSLLYLTGHRETLLGVSIPVFDGPTLSCIVFAALLAFRYQQDAPSRSKIVLLAISIAGCLLVTLSLRRTYWAELAIGMGILLVRRRGHRLRGFVFAGAAVLIAAMLLGSSFTGRVLSLDVTHDDDEFSADNRDHLHDLVDAWDQVRQSPVMGIGLGTSYSTWHIRKWKPESVMVHNAPLHVWLKYGIAGLICYLWFHVALLRWVFRKPRSAPGPGAPFLHAALAYLTAQFVVTLGFAPWPYSELQLSMLLSFVVAGGVMASGDPLCEGAPGAPLPAR